MRREQQIEAAVALHPRADADHEVLGGQAERSAQRRGGRPRREALEVDRSEDPEHGPTLRSRALRAAERGDTHSRPSVARPNSQAIPRQPARSNPRCGASGPGASRRACGARPSRAPRSRDRAYARCGRRRRGARRADSRAGARPRCRATRSRRARATARAPARRRPRAHAAAGNRAGRSDPPDTRARRCSRARAARAGAGASAPRDPSISSRW